RAVEAERRRADRVAAPRLEQELSDRGHRDPRRGLPGQGWRQPSQRARHHIPGWQETLRRFVRHGRTRRETREVRATLSVSDKQRPDRFPVSVLLCCFWVVV